MICEKYAEIFDILKKKQYICSWRLVHFLRNFERHKETNRLIYSLWFVMLSESILLRERH